MLDITIYFCEQYASFQRGSNEHVNGIIRRFYKKKTNFSEISDLEIAKVINKIDNILGKVFYENIAQTNFNAVKKEIIYLPDMLSLFTKQIVK